MVRHIEHPPSLPPKSFNVDQRQWHDNYDNTWEEMEEIMREYYASRIKEGGSK